MIVNLLVKGKVEQVEVDDKIVDLVKAMNDSGYETFASCQGHNFPIDVVKPYIAFKAPTQHVGALEKLLRDDIESIEGKMKWFWCIQGSFNDHYELVYSLSPHTPCKKRYKYVRKTLDADFKSIIDMLKKIKTNTKPLLE
ncbi:hypothetical protein [Citrobacter koseri]|uniref:hypothetical protein n=1 Tax=Citrobacter koseri TaxID=545 RepID=UPI003891F717